MTVLNPMLSVTEQNFDHDVYRLMQEIKRGDAIARLKSDMSSDTINLTLHKIARDLLKMLDEYSDRPEEIDIVETRRKLRKLTALLAVERMLSFGDAEIQIDFPENEVFRISKPSKQDPAEGFELTVRDLNSP